MYINEQYPNKVAFKKIIQSWTKYLEQSKEINSNRSGEERFDNCFFVIFDHCYENLILKDRPLLSLRNFDIFLIFPMSYDPKL